MFAQKLHWAAFVLQQMHVDPVDSEAESGSVRWMGGSLFENLSSYIDFGEDDKACLRRFHAVADEHLDGVVAKFYERVDLAPGAKAVLQDADQVNRLAVTLRLWLDRLLLGPWDADYARRRARIGERHVTVGLEQRYMLAALSGVRSDLLEIARSCYPNQKDFADLALALTRICDIDLTLMLETYRADSIDAVTRAKNLERELLERRLEITESRYQAIIENAEVLVIALDAESRIVLFNRRAEESTGYARSEIVGELCVDKLCHQGHRTEIQSALESALGGQPSPAFHARIITKRGRERWVRWHFTPLASAGEPVACAIGLDITEEHTLELQNRRAESLASLGTLAAGLAHEIRNPLNAAQLQLLLVERRLKRMGDAVASAAMEAAATVRAELGRLGVLVEDFLAFARPVSLRLESRNLVETIQEVVVLLEPDFAAESVQIDHISCDPVAARYDPERIKQVVINLLRNATEATGPGGSVKVEAFRRHNDAVIEVIDNGVGVPSEVDLFEPFQTTKDMGTGLGLSIVHRIISDHGGTIEVERRGEWTVFSVVIPVIGPTGAWSQEPVRS